jgi:hypothetical protein
MTRRKARQPKVVWRPLGKEKAWGMATTDPVHPLIEIDPRLSPRRELEVLCHEQLHSSLPDLPEAQIDRLGKEMSRTLWSQNYRRVLMGKHKTPVRISK